ncbi:MAG: hypothetical protein U1A78_39095 [Polyangia bacterium]
MGPNYLFGKDAVMVQVRRASPLWTLPLLLLACCGVGHTPPPPPAPAPDCPSGAKCWDFRKLSRAALVADGWSFVDPCWDVSSSALSTLGFPSTGSPVGADCLAQSPKLPDSSTGRYTLRIRHTVSQIKDLESNTKVLLQDVSAMRNELVLVVQEADGSTESSVPLTVRAGASANLQLLLHAGRNVTLAPGVWRVERVDVIPAP